MIYILQSCQVEMASKQHQLLTMPMLADVLAWQERVTDEPVAAPLAHVLEKCAERLAALFTRYIQDMVCTQISKCLVHKTVSQAYQSQLMRTQLWPPHAQSNI